MDLVKIAAVADICTGHQPPESAFTNVLATLRGADLRFAQVERLYARRGSYQEQNGMSGRPARQDPSFADVFKTVPFDILSLASNHTGDWGPEAVEDTVETFRLLGIPTVGAGCNVAEARKPVILERNGVRIAFLAYVSTVLPQFWANESRAGAAPMRAHTYYEPYEYQPGAPARVVTVPHAADLEHLVADVKQVRQHADVVLVSLHWGVHYVPRPCDYQPVVAHAAIDAGADVILGHHAHQPQGIEIYKNGVVFYSMGNFAFAPPRRKGSHSLAMPMGEYVQKDVYSLEPDPGFVFDYRRHFKEGGIVFLDVDRKGVARVNYMPTLMNDDGQPDNVRPGQPQFEKQLEYLNWAGRFIKGGVTAMKAAGDRYEVYVRGA